MLARPDWPVDHLEVVHGLHSAGAEFQCTWLPGHAPLLNLVEVAAVEGVVEELVGFEDWAVAEEPSLLLTSLEDEEADDIATPSLLTKGSSR